MWHGGLYHNSRNLHGFVPYGPLMEITGTCRSCGLVVADFDIVHDREGRAYLQCRRCGWLYREEDLEYEDK